MRFLVDEAVSWQVAHTLSEAGHDSIHVRDLGLAGSSDEQIMTVAARDDRTIITQDTDFGTLHFLGGGAKPSVVMLRLRDGKPGVQSGILLQRMPLFELEIKEGAIVIIGENVVRIRRLPIVDRQ